MSNFHALELDVIRRAEVLSILEIKPERYAFGTLRTTVDLCDAIALGEPIDYISDAMGRVAMDLIALCAILDIDLAKSLETAFNKISAKPVDTSKVEVSFKKSEVDAIVSEGVILREPYSHIKISGNAVRDDSPSTPVDTSNVVFLKQE